MAANNYSPTSYNTGNLSGNAIDPFANLMFMPSMAYSAPNIDSSFSMPISAPAGGGAKAPVSGGSTAASSMMSSQGGTADLLKALAGQQSNQSALLARLAKSGMFGTNLATGAIDPTTGLPMKGGELFKAPIARLFGGTNEPNFIDKLVYWISGRPFYPNGQAQDPTAMAGTSSGGFVFPDDYGQTYSGLNYGGEDPGFGMNLLGGGASDPWMDPSWSQGLMSSIPDFSFGFGE